MTLARHLYTVVRGRDSPIDIPLAVEGALVDSGDVTRCDLVFKRDGVADLTISSSIHTAWFDLHRSAVIDGQEAQIIHFDLRQISSPPTDGRYLVDVYLWDDVFTNGRFWGSIDVEIRPTIPTAA